MDKKFTPGPWKYLKGCELSGLSEEFGLGSYSWGCVEVSPKRYIKVEGRSNHEAEANANLIASAPELLEALELLYEHVTLYGLYTSGLQNGGNVKISAEEAIKKAYGEKP